MKRLLFTAVIVSLVLTLMIPLGVMAQEEAPGAGANCGENFIDEDGDGVCDRLKSSERTRGMHGRRGGSQGMGTGPNFVDVDEDGVCDHFIDTDGDGEPDSPPRDGTGMGYGRRGRGRGANFGMGNGL